MMHGTMQAQAHLVQNCPLVTSTNAVMPACLLHTVACHSPICRQVQFMADMLKRHALQRSLQQRPDE